MSRLSYIYSSYGKSFSIAIANTYSYNVLNSVNLPKNTIIVSSPFDSYTYEDLGQYSIIATDSYGVPTRITYSVALGNGIVNNNGSLAVEIDGNTIKQNSNGQLYIDLNSKIDSSTIEIKNNHIEASSANIKKASKNVFGVLKNDGQTVLSDNGKLSVNTAKLDLSDNTSDMFGIIKSESATVKATNGILSVNMQNIQKASDSSYGIAKVDGNTILSNNGVLSLNLNSFNYASSSSSGLSIPDNVTISENTENALRINWENMDKASSNTYGLIKSDESSTTLNNGILSIKNYSEIQRSVIELSNNINYLNEKIDKIKYDLDNLEIKEKDAKIWTFVCDGLASATLMRSKVYGEVPEKMITQKVSAKFIINTNCPFKISLEYFDNESPEVSLYEINYNDIDIYPGITGLTRTYQSTDEKDVKITLSWLCKNYRSNRNTEYNKKTKIILRVMYANDISINKEVKYSILRFNTLYNENIDYSGQNDELIIGKYKGKVQTHSVNYNIRMKDDNNTFTTYDSPSSYTITSTTDLYHAYYDTENMIHQEVNSYSLINNNLYSKIERYYDEGKPGTILNKSNLNNGSLKYTAYTYTENGNALTNDVSLDIDNYGNIVLNYNKGFEFEE